MKNPTQWANDQLAIRAAEAKAVESQLPGRRAGPADAYRHLIWAAELTRRFGEERARAILEAHEIQGSNSVDKDGNAQSPNEAEMDRHNNEIGIGLGKNAKTFDDVVSGRSKKAEMVIRQMARGRLGLIAASGRKTPRTDRAKNCPRTDGIGVTDSTGRESPSRNHTSILMATRNTNSSHPN